ncbi:PadR family transcriptional regulator [Fulvivirgaceae bacterium BMA10]|uniref:PadR family transcriptional regulator n=1 Tax=Splendidivirga corallicola TaxID=3051826 RepID=A0ABT8KL66_9BACT|nr:PadR family transcriptional regulator [Fulvivirgaceae bacterium BMA10]
MKEASLTEFERIVLLLTEVLGEDAYAFRVAEEFEFRTNRSIAIGTIHATLCRLENKGLVVSEIIRPFTEIEDIRRRVYARLKTRLGWMKTERGGRRKRLYSVTPYGELVLKAS